MAKLVSTIESKRHACALQAPEVGHLAPKSVGTVTEKISKREIREQLFAREYLLDLNGTQAAIRAGLSAKTAAQAGSRMLRNVKVRGLLRELIGRALGLSFDH